MSETREQVRLEQAKRKILNYFRAVGDTSDDPEVAAEVDELIAAAGAAALREPRPGTDGRLLHIAGLVNGYHNDDHALSAAETLAEIAKVLGPPMEQSAPQMETPMSDQPLRRLHREYIQRTGAVERRPPRDGA